MFDQREIRTLTQNQTNDQEKSTRKQTFQRSAAPIQSLPGEGKRLKF